MKVLAADRVLVFDLLITNTPIEKTKLHVLVFLMFLSSYSKAEVFSAKRIVNVNNAAGSFATLCNGNGHDILWETEQGICMQ